MVSTAPTHCHRCGGRLDSLDRRGHHRCPACDEYVFHNPAPNARVVVVDVDAALLVEITDESRLEEPPYDEPSCWMAPGGHPELGEQPEVAAARELEEETNLVVDPDELTLFDAVAREVVEGAHGVIVFYAVDRGDTSGSLAAATDANDARFWTPEALTEADAVYREMHREPAPYRSFETVIEMASSALDGRN